MSDFVDKIKEACVLLDCFSEIVIVNGFEEAMNLLREIKEICKEHDANLLISINPELFKKEQLAIIEKEMMEAR